MHNHPRHRWMRLLLSLALVSGAGAVAGAITDPAPLANGSFDPGGDMAGWTLGKGVALDPAVGAQAAGSLRFSLSPPVTNSSATVKLEGGLQPWRWYRLSFSYRMAPGTSASASWGETDQQGIAHTRSSRGRLSLAPTAEFTPASFSFISWPDSTVFLLTLEAHLISDKLTAGGLFLDDLLLQPVEAAAAAPQRVIARAAPNHGFESLNLPGYYNLMGGATATVAEGGAREGKRYLQVRGSAHLYPPLRHDLVFQQGHLYRISVWARGTGSVTPGLHLGYWLLDLDLPSTRQAFPLSPTEWREVRADLLIDTGDLRDAAVVLACGGEVDLDDLEVTRLR